VPVDAGLVRHVAFSDRAGAEAVAELLDSDLGITALFVANHEAAFGVIPELSRRKVSIPDQLSLLCYEDVPWFRWWSPAITVVDTDAASMAKLAVEVLLERMRQPLGGSDTGRIHRVESHFIPRDSCAPVVR
jgi:LacI family transcriptional regulator